MRAILVAIAAATALLSVTASANEGPVTREGVEIPMRAQVGEQELALVGHGVARYARIFRVYVAALYGPDDVAPGALLESDVPRRLDINYLRSVGAADIIEATDVVLQEQNGEEELAALEDRFRTFNALYRDVGEGDTYVYEYRPEGEESRLYFNGELQGSVSGEDFARAYLGIWLGDNALSASLREELLAGVE